MLVNAALDAVGIVTARGQFISVARRNTVNNPRLRESGAGDLAPDNSPPSGLAGGSHISRYQSPLAKERTAFLRHSRWFCIEMGFVFGAYSHCKTSGSFQLASRTSNTSGYSLNHWTRRSTCARFSSVCLKEMGNCASAAPRTARHFRTVRGLTDNAPKATDHVGGKGESCPVDSLATSLIETSFELLWIA